MFVPIPHSPGCARRRLPALLLLLLPLVACAELYRWVDDDGIPHYSDQPPAGGAESIASAGQPAARDVAVAEVVDGDTVALTDGTRLRIIGIDAPERARRGRPGAVGAMAAHEGLKALLDGATLRLEPGETTRDRYNRRLGYLRDAQNRDIGAEMLRAGLAVVSLHEDNAQRADAYFAAEAEARTAERGRWGTSELRPLPARTAAAQRNRYRQFEGRVVGARAGRSGAELRLEGGLTLTVGEAARARFAAGALRNLQGARIVVRGVVRQRDGKPIIHLRHPGQIDPR